MHPPLVDRVRTLLEASPSDPGAPEVEELEHTLTDGYAAALALEGECLRIGRQLDALAEDGTSSLGLRERLHETRRELTYLRDLLRVLRRRAEAARAAAQV